MQIVTDTVCPRCRGTGWERVSNEGAEGVVRCECTKRSRAARLLQEARIPDRYKHCELETFKLTNRSSERPANQSLAKAKGIAETFAMEFPTPTPFGLLFLGPPGVGKTHLAVGIIKRLIRFKSVPCLFRTFPDLLKEIQMTYNPVSLSSELSLMQPVLETDVLVLDELGAQTPSAWVKETVGYILNSRYNENKVTILTTNFIDQESFQDKNKGLDSP